VHRHKHLSENDQYLRAVEVLRGGGVVALPTDTVFGLCAVAADDAAVRRLYEIKRRRLDQPLPLFVADADQAALVAGITPAAAVLMARFWPGALTVVVPLRPSFATLAAAGSGSIGLRAPADAFLRELARQLGPITGTSANLSGQPEARSATEVRAQLGDAVDLIVDAPPASSGPPSTVVDCTGTPVRVLREGAVTRAAIASELKGIAEVAE
jgi:L-threonylcarbamoyladenylate synthase